MSEDGTVGTGVSTNRIGKNGRSRAGNLAEIAQRAQVSEATVSRVLNRRYGVAQATRASVHQAMNELGMHPQVSGELVLILTPGLVNPLFGDLAKRLQHELAPHGLRALVGAVSSGTAQEREYVETVVDAGIAAVVYLSTNNTLANADDGTVRLLRSRDIPVVTLNGGFEGISIPTFSTDDFRAAELAVEHLYGLGHRRIGMCAGPVGNIPSDRRVDGFVQTMERLGEPNPEDFVAHHFYSVEGGRHAADCLLDLGVTAIMASSDEMALGALRAAKAKGISVPGELSVIGYDDWPVLDFVDPPLTSVRQPVERLAENTARTIVAMIEKRPVSTDELFIEPTLHLRASTAPPPSV